MFTIHSKSKIDRHSWTLHSFIPLNAIHMPFGNGRQIARIAPPSQDLFLNRTVVVLGSCRIILEGYGLTGVRKDSATNRALAFSYRSCVSKIKAIIQSYSHTNNFISDISLSTSSINCMIKSTSLCFSISSVWKFVMRKEMSYP